MSDVQLDDDSWEEFYQAVEGRDLRPLFVEAMTLINDEPAPDKPRTAYDLGCGDGRETLALLSAGWQVTAVDAQEGAIQRVLSATPEDQRARLSTQQSSYEAIDFQPADLVYAGYSLPFCPPDHFETVWGRIVSALKPGGRFAGQFFGVNDDWADQPDVVAMSREQAELLLGGLQVEHFEEEDADGTSTIGPKHWHVFHIIARKGT